MFGLFDESTQPVHDVLRVSQRWNGTLTTIDRTDPHTGQVIPTWTVFHHQERRAVSITHMGQPLHATGPPLGTAQMRSMSSKIDLVLRGMQFTMWTESMSSSGHKFIFPGSSELRWRGSSMDSKVLYLEDAHKNRLARFRPSKKSELGMGMTQEYGVEDRGVFELYIPPGNIDMDLLILTGMAAVVREGKDRKAANSAAGEIVESVLS